MDELLPYTEAVARLARRQGRTRVGGIRISVRGAGDRMDAELLSFAGTSPREERALVVCGTGRPLLYVHALEDLAARLTDLGDAPIAP